MREQDSICEGKSDAVGLDRISQALHDLCQPLTTLQCRLEIAQLGGSPEDYREAVKLSMVECERLIESVGEMRKIVRAVRGVETEQQVHIGVRR